MQGNCIKKRTQQIEGISFDKTKKIDVGFVKVQKVRPRQEMVLLVRIYRSCEFAGRYQVL